MCIVVHRPGDINAEGAADPGAAQAKENLKHRISCAVSVPDIDLIAICKLAKQK